jgi:dTDP-4-amino-4,6-dideoxygalactose transaminase
LQDIPGLTLISAPGGTAPNYWFYSLLVEKREYGLDRDGLIKLLVRNNIEGRPVWYLNHWQKAYKHCQSYQIEKAEYYWQRVVNIPCSANLTKQDILRVARTIAGARG